MKTCRVCGENKPLEAFHRSRRAWDGRQSRCQPCARAYAREHYRQNKERHTELHLAWEMANPEKKRSMRLKHSYGITLTQYNDMLKNQGGMCAICRGSCDRNARLSVDHDHRCCPGRKSCGECVRGLLCDDCNNGIARLKDSCDMLRAATKYLASF